ncbi:MAG TPA: entericidin A/B family lipoprotein [Methylophilus sp.]
MKKWILISLLPLVLVACNTVEGVGKDIKRAGEVVQDSAK